LNDDNVKNWFQHSFTLSVTPEALLILQAAHAKADFFQLSTLSSEVDELIPYPTYDSLVTQGILTSELFTEHGLDSDQELAAARVKFEAAITLDPTRPEALCGLGALEERSHPVKAAEYFKKALTMWPSHAEAQRGHERCQARLNTPASYVPNLEITRPLENPPAKLFEAALAYFGSGDRGKLAPEDIAKNIRTFLRRESEAFRKLEEELAPTAFVHTWGKELQDYVAEIAELAQAIQRHPNQQQYERLSNLISQHLGTSGTGRGVHFSTRLKVLSVSAQELDDTSQVLKTAVRSKDMTSLLAKAESWLGKLEPGSQQGAFLAEVTAWAQNTLKTVQAINSDMQVEYAALTFWSERFAATIYGKLRESAATQQTTTPPARKRKLEKQSSNPNSDSPEIVLTR
jgi:tetratricopeptide (TPR) repeat protein